MSVGISPYGKLQWFDDNGAPLAGGSLYTYISGTTTDKDTYTTYLGNVKHTNPIVLDAAGRAEIWLDSDVAYTFLLKDSLGNTIWTMDGITPAGGGGSSSTGLFFLNYAALRANTTLAGVAHVAGATAAGDGGNGWFYYSTASTATDDAGTILLPGSAPPAGRWIRFMAGYVDPFWWGTVADGSTSDTTKIAAARSVANTYGLPIRFRAREKINVSDTCINTYTMATSPGTLSSVEIEAGASLFWSGFNLTITNLIISPTDRSRKFVCTVADAPVLLANDYVYPEWFGAVASSNSAVAIQVAINSCRKVIFGSGTFLIEAPVYLRTNGTILQGNGRSYTILAMPSSTNINMINANQSSAQANNFEIRDIGFSGANQTHLYDSRLIDLDCDTRSYNGVIENCTFTSSNSEAIYAAKVDNLIIRGCVFTACGVDHSNNAIAFVNCAGNLVEVCGFYSTGTPNLINFDVNTAACRSIGNYEETIGSSRVVTNDVSGLNIVLEYDSAKNAGWRDQGRRFCDIQILSGATPSVKTGNLFSTNGGGTTITNFADGVEGQIIDVIGYSSGTGSLIANAGNFTLVSDITLSAGSAIRLIRYNSKWVEIARRAVTSYSSLSVNNMTIPYPGYLTFGDGATLIMPSGGNAPLCGIASCSGGTTTVYSTAIKATSRIFVNCMNGTFTLYIYCPFVRNIVPGASFDICVQDNASSRYSGDVAWLIINPT